MNSIFLLTLRYLAFNKIKTAIMLICLSITFFLPIAVHLLIQHYENELMARAKSTPLVVGSKGNRYDLVLKSLYFTAENPEPLSMAEVDALKNSGRGLGIPMHIRFTARGYPLVGTTQDYFEFRKLKTAEGTLPLVIGDVVLGAEVAAGLGLSEGDRLLTDQTDLYDISAVYPLKLHVAGVLAPAGSPDDHAVFVDIKTAWIIAGIGHGHMDLLKTSDSSVLLEKKKDEVVGNAALLQYAEITEQNMDKFHFHGERSSFPVTSYLVLPDSEKSSTILKGRYSVSKTEQMLVPVNVINELMGIVFQVKKFFDANFALVSVSVALFVFLVFMLSLKIRSREMRTMFRIGCSRMTLLKLQVSELCLLAAASLLVAGVLTLLVLNYAPQLVSVI